jgi:hypothetical protein
MTTLINLTGITITYRDGEEIRSINPSGWRLLAPRTFTPTGRCIGNANIVTTTHALQELPPKAKDTIYIVDPIVADAMKEHGIERDDIVVSHGASAERDDRGRIVATRAFVLANPPKLSVE